MRAILVLLAVGAAGLAAGGTGLARRSRRCSRMPGSRPRSLALGWPLGSIALLLIHALTGGRWGEAVRVPLLLGVVTLPLVLLRLCPGRASCFPALYPWVHHDVAEQLYNTWYLNVAVLRRPRRWSTSWSGSASPVVALLGGLGRGALLRRVAPPGLILLALTATFAAIDLTASLDPEYNSSVYGMLTGTGMVLLALSIALLFAVPAARGASARRSGQAAARALHPLGLSRLRPDAVIWSSNLAHDAPWIERRFDGFWGWSFGVMAVLHALWRAAPARHPRLPADRRGRDGLGRRR